MATEYIGASIEPRKVPMWALFAINKQVHDEIERRAWLYLRAIGYVPFREKTIDVNFGERSSVQVVSISASFEQNYSQMNISIDVPYKLFEAAVPHDGEA